MAVHFPLVRLDDLRSLEGVFLGSAQAGLYKVERPDVLVVGLPPTARTWGVFTQNRFCAPPVTVCRENLARTASVRAMVINSGCANAGTGQQGYDDARATCAEAARLLSCREEEVLPFSTGVIMEYLPMQKLLPAIDLALQQPVNWLSAARAIMTTDTKAKAVSRTVEIDGNIITLTGIAKGSGMIHPNMATMLAYLFCDVALPQDILKELSETLCQYSFNAITVDGDTSTNDSFMLSATGTVNVEALQRRDHPRFATAYAKLYGALLEAAQTLAQMIVRDGEGATKFITLKVRNAPSESVAKKVAYAVAHSPLVKTAFFASDPNLGRILAAIGYADMELDLSAMKLRINDVLVSENGARAQSYKESDGVKAMQESDINVVIDLNQGSASATVWTCDLSHDYVSINSDYRS